MGICGAGEAEANAAVVNNWLFVRVRVFHLKLASDLPLIVSRDCFDQKPSVYLRDLGKTNSHSR
jgi:hypothetical protein